MSFTTSLKQYLTLLLCALVLNGCDVPLSETLAPESAIKTISIYTGDNINGHMGLSVDFIQVYDKNLFETLKGLDANAFNAKRNQIHLDNPNGMQVWSFDFVERQSLCFQFPAHKNYWGMIIYIHFSSGIDTRVLIPREMIHTRLQIADGRFTMSPERSMQHCVHLQAGD